MTIIGIDLGTTNSLGAYWRDGKAHLIPNVLKEFLTPSVVGVDEDGSILIGAAARERLLTHPGLTVATFKRRMGSSSRTQLGANSFSPEELSSLVLKSIKADAEACLDSPVTDVVISVPAYFNDVQRKATQLAGELAGFTVRQLINEPTAAAVAYSLHDREEDSKFMVLDIGGGTFDVSILELFDGVMEVHASSGDNYLGGEDFTAVLQDWFLEAHELKPDQLSAIERNRLIGECEQAKRALGSAENVRVSLQHADQSLELVIHRDEYRKRCESLLSRIQLPIERALRDAGMRAAALNDVVLVGGATRLDMVRSMIARLFSRFPSSTINPDEVVALGTAIQAALLEKDEALTDVVLTDVAPYTLGIDVSRELSAGRISSGHFSPILDRNSLVPVSREEQFQTLQDNQREIRVDVYQGEHRMVENNIKLGGVSVEVPPGKAGEQSVNVRFTYNVNGLLEVEIKVVGTEKMQKLLIDSGNNQMSDAEIAACFEKLADLKIHPRDNQENRTVLARAERVYEELLGDYRQFLGVQIEQFERAVEQQDMKEISLAREELASILDQIESERRF